MKKNTKLESIKLSELKPAEYNPRFIKNDDFERLSKNIKEFGLVDPIIINLKNNHIVGGHQRYKVLLSEHGENKDLQLLRFGDIGWVFEDLNLQIKDENHEKSLNISLNKISGDWEYNKLTKLINELNNKSFDVSLTGFNDVELSAFNSNEEIILSDGLFGDEYYNVPESTMKKKNNKCKCPKCQYEF